MRTHFKFAKLEQFSSVSSNFNASIWMIRIAAKIEARPYSWFIRMLSLFNELLHEELA